ncbi:MAG: type II toxin-antitoxin system RelE/ParE family toxin [Candidatus Thiodiazotropha sp. LLP2]
MSAFSVSRAARADLKNIAAYTQKVWGAEQRRTYLKGLDLAFRFLADNPLAGSPCEYVAEGLRKHRFESHTIFYENVDSAVLIVRVLHNSMDAERNYQDP